MKRQQENFATLRKNEELDIKKMEEAEQQRLDAYQAKKALEKSRKDQKKRSHQQIVCRVLSKKFLGSLKVKTFTYMRDVGHFKDQFMQTTMEPDVLPWLLEEAQIELDKLNGHNSYPNTLINNYMAKRSEKHVDCVKAYKKKIQERREAERKAAGDKIAAKQERARQRQAAAKAAQIAKLKEEVKENFIDKATPVEEILKQPYVDVDGWSA